MTESTGAPDTNETPPASEAPPAPTPAPGPITGPRAAAAALVVSCVVMFVMLGRVAYFEAAFAIALVISERDHRIKWVRYALLAFVAYGLVVAGRGTLETGDWVNMASIVMWAGGFGALSYLEDDVPKIAVLFAISLAGLLGVFFV